MAAGLPSMKDEGAANNCFGSSGCFSILDLRLPDAPMNVLSSDCGYCMCSYCRAEFYKKLWARTFFSIMS